MNNEPSVYFPPKLAPNINNMPNQNNQQNFPSGFPNNGYNNGTPRNIYDNGYRHNPQYQYQNVPSGGFIDNQTGAIKLNNFNPYMQPYPSDILSSSEGYANGGYSSGGYSSGGYSSGGYSSIGYSSGYASAGYASEGYPNGAYDNAGYCNEGYASAGCPTGLNFTGRNSTYEIEMPPNNFSKDYNARLLEIEHNSYLNKREILAPENSKVELFQERTIPSETLTVDKDNFQDFSVKAIPNNVQLNKRDTQNWRVHCQKAKRSSDSKGKLNKIANDAH